MVLDHLESRTPLAISGITAAADVSLLKPADGQVAPVTISGTITIDRDAEPTATFLVSDEYREALSSGPIALTPVSDGVYSYSFGVGLPADVHEDDTDGRNFSVSVQAQDRFNGASIAVPVQVAPASAARVGPAPTPQSAGSRRPMPQKIGSPDAPRERADRPAWGARHRGSFDGGRPVRGPMLLATR